MKKLLTNSKILSASIVLAMAMAGSANAATVNFGNANNLNSVAQLASDSSGLTSVNVPNNNLTNGSNGFFVETFDKATQTIDANTNAPFPVGDTQYNDNDTATNDFDGCAVNGVGSGITVNTSSSGAFGVRQGSVTNVAAAPLNDTTCFGYTPQDKSTLPSWVEVDYSVFLANAGGAGITFLGFYWGSIDTYNDFVFFDADDVEIQTITGTSLLSDANGSSGNQGSPASNLYVAIDFTLAESFTKLRINSNGAAGEFDNIVIGLENRMQPPPPPPNPVPAPTGLALLGLGLLGIGLRNRLSK